MTPALARDPEGALHAWNAAPLVFVGVDLAKALARLAPPRRAGVHLVGCGGVPDDVFRTALALGRRERRRAAPVVPAGWSS